MNPVSEIDVIVVLAFAILMPSLCVLIAMALPSKPSYIGRPRIERRRRG